MFHNDSMLGSSFGAVCCSKEVSAAYPSVEKVSGTQMHRPWYIDFRGDPLICSKVDFAKNVIFENVAEANARVYWEVYHFAKAMSKDNSNFRMGPWWANQRTFF